MGDTVVAGWPCVICGRTDDAKPLCYRRTPYCCGLHETWALRRPRGQVNGFHRGTP